jgi:hypothetical protein
MAYFSEIMRIRDQMINETIPRTEPAIGVPPAVAEFR